MAVNAAGQFTGRWLFSAVILTTLVWTARTSCTASRLNGREPDPDLLTQGVRRRGRA